MAKYNLIALSNKKNKTKENPKNHKAIYPYKVINRRVHIEWFNLFENLNWAKLVFQDRNEISSSLGGRWLTDCKIA